jgi:hypothetical protein
MTVPTLMIVVLLMFEPVDGKIEIHHRTIPQVTTGVECLRVAREAAKESTDAQKAIVTCLPLPPLKRRERSGAPVV